MIDTTKVQNRIAELARTFKAYLELTSKDPAKVTKGDKRRITIIEQELKSILQPEERSDLTVDVNTVAKFYGITVRQVHKWVAQKGCPKLKHGLYDLKAVYDWWCETFVGGEESVAIESVKLEYWRWKSENEKMKALHTKEELVARSDIAPLWSARILEVGTGLYALATRLPPLLEAKDQRQMAAIIRAEIRKLHERYSREGRFCASR